MVTRCMTEADAEAVSALMLRSYDRVLVHYHSAEMLRRFREHATPESLVEQLERKQLFVVEDHGRVVATGGLGWMDGPGTTARSQPGPHAPGVDRRVTNLFVAVDLLGRGVGRLLLDHLIGLAKADGTERLHVASVRNAVGFYERAGFVVDPAPPRDIPEITWLILRP